jgi:hypothetical protein
MKPGKKDHKDLLMKEIMIKIAESEVVKGVTVELVDGNLGSTSTVGPRRSMRRRRSLRRSNQNRKVKIRAEQGTEDWYR